MTAALPISKRSLYLSQAVHAVRPIFGRVGLQLPGRVLVKDGPLAPSGGDLVLGQCWSAEGRPDRSPVIVVNSLISTGFMALEVLMHELIHTADDCRDDHGAWFRHWADTLGLRGSVSTYASLPLADTLNSIANRLGPYPSATDTFVMARGGLVAG